MEPHTVFVVDGVEHRQGCQGALQAPWRGAGQGSLGGFQGPPFSLTPPPEAVQEKGDLNSYLRSPARNSEQDDDAVLHSVLQKGCTTRESYKKDRLHDNY